LDEEYIFALADALHEEYRPSPMPDCSYRSTIRGW
jgi:hypothetical protein